MGCRMRVCGNHDRIEKIHLVLTKAARWLLLHHRNCSPEEPGLRFPKCDARIKFERSGEENVNHYLF